MRKAYFFMLDVIVGIVILGIGLILIMGYYFYFPQKTMTDTVATDMTGILANVRVDEICPGMMPTNCVCGDYPAIEDLCIKGVVKNTHLTIMELMGQLYYNNRRKDIEAVVNDTLIDNRILPLNHDLQILLSDPQSTLPQQQIYPVIEVP
jgi:hypothetical protein